MKFLKRINDPFLSYLPTIDLHGVDRNYAVIKVDEFVYDNSILGNKKLVVIHGIGKGIIKREIHKYLSRDKRVKSYKLDNNNLGVTIIEIR